MNEAGDRETSLAMASMLVGPSAEIGMLSPRTRQTVYGRSREWVDVCFADVGSFVE